MHIKEAMNNNSNSYSNNNANNIYKCYMLRINILEQRGRKKWSEKENIRTILMENFY